MRYIVHDASGRILRGQTGNLVGPDEIATPDANGESVNSDVEWIDGGVRVARPAITLPVSVPAGAALDLGGLPPETVLTVRNEAGQEASGTAGAGVTLADPGAYRIRAEPPWPWQAIDHRIEAV